MYIDLLTHPRGVGHYVLSAIIDDDQIWKAMSDDFESSEERPRVVAREFVVHWADHEGDRHWGDYVDSLEGAVFLFNQRSEQPQWGTVPEGYVQRGKPCGKAEED